MSKRILLSVLPAALAVFIPVAAESAHAADAIVSPMPTSGGSSIMTALEAAKAFPAAYPGNRLSADMTGRVLVRFHVGSDGHPENIQVVQGAPRGELNLQTRESVARAVCLACAGRDYTVAFNYQER
jgi:TonB family protein